MLIDRKNRIFGGGITGHALEQELALFHSEIEIKELLLKDGLISDQSYKIINDKSNVNLFSINIIILNL